MYIGSWKIDDLVTFAVNTHNASTGAETDADSVPTYRIYEDETGTAILTGSMAKLDDANTTGYYSEQITLSVANGFEKGKSYNIRISATVSGVTGTTTRNLQIEAEVDANVVSDKTGYSLSVTPPTAVQIRQEIDSNSTDLDAIIGFLDTEIADIQTSIAALPTDNDVKNAVLGDTGIWVAGSIGAKIGLLTSMNSMLTNVSSVTTQLQTTIEFDGGVYRFTTNALEQATTPIVQGVLGNSDPWVSGSIGGIIQNFEGSAGQISNIESVTTQLGTMLILDGSIYQFTANALELAPTGGGGSDPLTGEIEAASGSNPAVTLKEAIQLILSFMLGLSTGGGTEELVFRDVNDSRNCVTMTVDGEANRLSLTRITVP